MLSTVGRSSAVSGALKRAFAGSALHAADAVSVTGDISSPFLKFGSPVPSDVGVNQYLADLPETKVCESIFILPRIIFFILSLCAISECCYLEGNGLYCIWYCCR